MKLKIALLALIMSTTLVGCSNFKEENNNELSKDTSNVVDNNLNKTNTSDNISDSQNVTPQENNTIETELKSNDNQSEDTQPKFESNIKQDNIETDSNKPSYENFKLYTLDVNDTDKIVEYENISLDKNLSVNDKITKLLLALKKDYFQDDKANIYLESIDNNGIATINLVDEASWRPHFQGSTGGQVSQKTIIETILQRDYTGDWINGVNVIIDGKKQEVFDHASFNATFYR
ncbi:hypothetical protein [Paraclostridium bifermentans]|uniref:hypothetical protein n=1 Tax=Paraclostridium bifermentans TaxID=1490 RepID=UPI00359C2E2F